MDRYCFGVYIHVHVVSYMIFNFGSNSEPFSFLYSGRDFRVAKHLSSRTRCNISIKITSFHYLTSNTACRGSAKIAGWIAVREIRVRFPAYRHPALVLWWQVGKRRIRTSRCLCQGKPGMLKTLSYPWRWVPGSRQNLETGQLSRHYIAEISLNVT